MRFAFIQEQQKQSESDLPIRHLCRALNVSASGYYDYVRRQNSPSPSANRRLELSEKIASVHAISRQTYGSPRICRQLRDEGETVSEKTVAKIMKTLQIQGKSPWKKNPYTTGSRHDQPVAENLLNRQFEATAANQKWASDITYIETDEGWLYLAVVIDLFSRRVVGWATADHMRADLVCEAMSRAIMQRSIRQKDHAEDSGKLLHHSDRGGQYASGDFQKLLEDYGMCCSMSRKGNCWDNAVVESFFGTLKSELDEPFATREIAHAKLFDYIEVFYNRMRLHSTLNYMNPAAFEAMHQAA